MPFHGSLRVGMDRMGGEPKRLSETRRTNDVNYSHTGRNAREKATGLRDCREVAALRRRAQLGSVVPLNRARARARSAAFSPQFDCLMEQQPTPRLLILS